MVPSRESNSGLPYSKPMRYQLSHAAPCKSNILLQIFHEPSLGPALTYLLFRRYSRIGKDSGNIMPHTVSTSLQQNDCKPFLIGYVTKKPTTGVIILVKIVWLMDQGNLNNEKLKAKFCHIALLEEKFSSKKGTTFSTKSINYFFISLKIS